MSDGIKLVMLYSVAATLSQTLRNYFFFYTFNLALRVRKTLIINLFDKISKLSIRSLAQTRQGKLISLVSSEIFSLEKGLTLFPLIITAPFINIACYIVLGVFVEWYFALSTFLLWLLVFLIQYLMSLFQKDIKEKEG